PTIAQEPSHAAQLDVVDRSRGVTERLLPSALDDLPANSCVLAPPPHYLVESAGPLEGGAAVEDVARLEVRAALLDFSPQGPLGQCVHVDTVRHAGPSLHHADCVVGKRL